MRDSFQARGGKALRRRWRVAGRYAFMIRALGLRRFLRRVRNDRKYAEQHATQLTRVTKAIWKEAADTVGAEMRECSSSITEFRLGNAVVQVMGQRTPFASLPSVEIASDKPLAYRLLREAGLPVPEHVLVRPHDVDAALQFLEQHAGPHIVKPARGGAGEGVVGAVRTPTQLRRAIRRASARYADVLVEREVAGDHYRLLVLDGDVLDVVRRTRPQIVGNGRSTVEELIEREYEDRLESDEGATVLKPFVVDLDALFTLEQQGLELGSIPPDGAVLTVMSASNFGRPEDSETFQGTVSPLLETEVRLACAVLGTRLGGVDVITTRTDIALSASGGVILEVNPIPGLQHHYAVADRASATRVAVPILRALFDDSIARTSASLGQSPPDGQS